MKKQNFQATIKNLHKMLSFIDKAASELGFPPMLSDKLVLASEEALVNIIHYAYPLEKGNIEIVCEPIKEKHGVEVRILDQGILFNPLKIIQDKKNKPHHIDSVNESTCLGGYGIFLYIELMDHVHYNRTERGNELHLIKYF